MGFFYTYKEVTLSAQVPGRVTLNETTGMALSNAERQRKYRQRRINDGKAKIGVFISADAMNKLNALAAEHGASIATVLDSLILDKAIEVVEKPTSLCERLSAIESRLSAIEVVTSNVTSNVTSVDIIEELPEPELTLVAPKPTRSRIQYSNDDYQKVALMKSAGATSDAIHAEFIKRYGERLPKSFKSNLDKMIKPETNNEKT